MGKTRRGIMVAPNNNLQNQKQQKMRELMGRRPKEAFEKPDFPKQVRSARTAIDKDEAEREYRTRVMQRRMAEKGLTYKDVSAVTSVTRIATVPQKRKVSKAEAMLLARQERPGSKKLSLPQLMCWLENRKSVQRLLALMEKSWR